ncbi:MAG TPA: VirB3 family type IV secretion system protein [Bacillota bacterium]|jgi:type IV secretory pathway TrbD component|nr:VirB3 family type IV secretion system protein [Bacillota bacterium]HOL09910.1 VirB3 family type IV secretion system protein [Bacillota bacterium]HPO98134.1 VirB3 family type IV secretion system protein [Bacillota bacterium]
MEGYRIPIHHSLTEQILLGGVPRGIAILNGTLAAAFALGMHTITPLPICLVVHIVAMFAAKKDPQFFDCFKRHIQQKSYYSN